MSELQSGVAQEIERQVRVATDASTTAMEGPAELVECRRADVRELRALEVAPDRFHGVQLRSIARQAFDRQPPPLARQVVAHHAAL